MWKLLVSTAFAAFLSLVSITAIGSRAALAQTNVFFTEWTVPTKGSHPHDPLAAADGTIWYTGQMASVLGHTVREWRSPSGPNSGPYGIANLGDVIWYSESGVKPNTLVRFDPRTEKFKSWTIPSGGGVVRNMATTSDGKLVLACSGVDRIALVDVRQHE